MLSEQFIAVCMAANPNTVHLGQ